MNLRSLFMIIIFKDDISPNKNGHFKILYYFLQISAYILLYLWDHPWLFKINPGFPFPFNSLLSQHSLSLPCCSFLYLSLLERSYDNVFNLLIFCFPPLVRKLFEDKTFYVLSTLTFLTLVWCQYRAGTQYICIEWMKRKSTEIFDVTWDFKSGLTVNSYCAKVKIVDWLIL